MSSNSTIKIKRSSSAGSPAVLSAGELAYSALPNNDSNGGDRLYIGFGTETNGNAAERIVIGGKYFTDLLDHTRGTLTADSALIVDTNKKINEFLVDDLFLDANQISTESGNINILITPHGTGKTVVKNLFIDDDETSLEDFVTSIEQDTLSIAGDSGSQSVSFADDSLNFVSGTNAGVSVDVTRGTSPNEDKVFVTVSLDQDLSSTGSPTFVDLSLSGGNLNTTDATATIFNTTATTLNIGNDATTISIGAGSGTTTINNDLVVSGDLTVQGTLTSLETVNLQTDDPLVKFGSGNTPDSLSIGFYGEYVDDGTTLKTGFFRDHVSKEYFLFKDLDADLQENQINASTVTLADLNLYNITLENDLTVGNDVTVTGDITGDNITASLFIGEIDGGTY